LKNSHVIVVVVNYIHM